MERLQLSAQDALLEASVTRAHDRSTITCELQRDTHTGGPHVPRVERAQAADHCVALTALGVEHREVLADGPAVIEAQPHVQRHCFADRDRVAGECGSGHEHTARI